MRKANLIALAAVAACLLASSLAHGQAENPPAKTKESGKTSGKGMTAAEQTGKGGSAEQTIKALSEQLNQAALKGDTATYEKLVSDDYISIGIYGTVSTKANLLENFKSGKLKFEAVDVLDTNARVYGDTALLIATANVKGHLGDTDISGQYRSTRVWIKRKGQWRNVSFQATRVAQQP
jgi:ketosteroid isomerase-like protein